MNIVTLGAILLLADLSGFAQQAVVGLDTAGVEWTAEGATVRVPQLRENQIITGELEGRWITSIRLASPTAVGMQFLIEDLTLPEGAKLSLVELTANGETVRGMYQGAGPLDGGAFWTDAVAGSEAILRVSYEGEIASDLPFRVTRARHLNAYGLKALAREDTEPSLLEGAAGTARFRGRSVQFQVRGGVATAEGDILLGGIDEIEIVGSKGNNTRESMGITSATYRWPGGVVPYVIDSALTNQARVTDAVAQWNTNLAGVIRLVPRTTEAYYVRFAYSSSAGTCNSYIGMIRMAGQPINLGDYCSAGNVVHEIGHAIGLFHEHTREDRNNKVQIQLANIDPSMVSNFNQSITTSDDLGTYDYGSIMHYPAYAFSINGQPTIVTIPAGIPIGQRSALSTGDISGVRQMYSSTPTSPATVAVTLSSNPAGRSLIVDGIPVTAPAIFNWTPGGVHSVSAPSSTNTTAKYTFASWSDGGAQTHNITAPSAAVMLTATFAAAYKITADSANTSLGTVGISPTSADSFYAQGTSVKITATTRGGSCLGGWSGVSAPASSPIQVSASQPYGIVANFQTGSVTLPSTLLTTTWKGSNTTVAVTASTGCSWSASTAFSWIQILSGAGTGSGSFRISVSQNKSTASRTGTVNVGSSMLTVTQTGR